MASIQRAVRNARGKKPLSENASKATLMEEPIAGVACKLDGQYTAWGEKISRKHCAQNLSRKVSNAVDNGDYNEIPSIIEALSDRNIQEENVWFGALKSPSYMPLYEQCCRAIRQIVERGHTPLSGEMVDRLADIAGKPENSRISIAIYLNIFGGLCEKRAVGTLVKAASSYKPSVPRNRVVGPYLDWGYNAGRDGNRSISLAVAEYAQKAGDIAAAAVVALRNIGDIRALGALRRIDNKIHVLLGSDSYLGIVIERLIKAPAYDAIISRMMEDVSSEGAVEGDAPSEETLAARERVQKLLGGGGICWENPTIREQNEIRFAIELA